ncbi:MAG: 2-oxoglutarate dehydrogenase [Bacteroidales bacterium 36-12]|nr:MAG: 2-oxoglutarate dehydrogenase [Bacteroidales bacterium 36-12]
MAIVEIKIPSPGESVNQVELFKWNVVDGDFVEKNAEIASLESDKATLPLIASESGVITLVAKEGDSLDVGIVACTIDTSVKKKEFVSDEINVDSNHESDSKQDILEIKDNLPKIHETSVLESKIDKSKIRTTPSARQLLVEHDLSVEDVINGLRSLGKADVEAYLNKPKSSISELKNVNREIHTERLSLLRRKMSERLVAVKNETAMLTTFNEVNMQAIMDLRSKYQDKFKEKYNVKLGIMSFFVKACSIALQEYSAINSMIDGENMIKYNYADISVAVSTPRGLMVPVVRNAESMSLSEIELTIGGLAEKARNGTISISEMSGGTFTITNGGVFGSMLSTPIINPPQSAILGMHSIIDRPIVVNKQIIIAPMMYIALSYDHRIVDGKDSVGFLIKVKELLENPTAYLFNQEEFV